MHVHSGLVQQLNIPRLFEAEPPFLERCRTCLITSIDSDREVTDLLGHRARSDRGSDPDLPSCTRLGRGVVLDMDDLAALLGHNNYFTGFDEIWLFPSRPPEQLPGDVLLTSDTRILRAGASQVLARWMADARCVVGLGDGAGLNYVTLHPDVAQMIETAGAT